VRRSLSQSAYDLLLDEIVSGALPPGARLRDRDVAQRLGASRTPVREALRRLADEGLVEVAPQSATRVAPVDVSAAADAFPVVAGLQGLAARLGTPGLTGDRLTEMSACREAKRTALAAGDVPSAIAADDAFHAVLVAAAGNRELRRSLDRLMPQIRRLDLLHFRALSRHEATDHDDAVLDACRRGAADEAARLVEASFLALGASVAELLLRAETVDG